MKSVTLAKITLGLAALGAFAAATYAADVPGQKGFFTATLNEFHVDPNSDLTFAPTAGSLALNGHQARLVLHPHTIYCFRSPCPQPIGSDIRLPVVSVEEIGCGSLKIVAQRDMRMVDGILQRLTVIDHSHRVCMDLRQGVEVAYETDAPRTNVKTRSWFGGTGLVEIAPSVQN